MAVWVWCLRSVGEGWGGRGQVRQALGGGEEGWGGFRMITMVIWTIEDISDIGQ